MEGVVLLVDGGMHNSTVVKCKKGQNGSNPEKEKGGGSVFVFKGNFTLSHTSS